MDNDIRNYIKVDKLSKEKQPEIFEKEGRGYFYTHNGASACVFHIKCGCAHSYISEVKASIIEYSPEKYQKSDTVKYSFKWENEIF